jgi:hypothetical protein
VLRELVGALLSVVPVRASMLFLRLKKDIGDIWKPKKYPRKYWVKNPWKP